MNLNREVKVLTLLEKAGYEAFFVGGLPRDKMLDKESFDGDIATNATPDEVEKVLKKHGYINTAGKNFLVTLYSEFNDPKDLQGVEIATYRYDKEYIEEKENKVGKPDVEKAESMYEDASRRDFTCNALYMDVRNKIYDPTGLGVSDIKSKTIRAVGDAKQRFTEDASRILRGFYLASKLDFSIHPDTLKVIKENHQLINKIPKELVGKLVAKAIEGGNFTKFVSLLYDNKLLHYVFPSLEHMYEHLPQNPQYHKYDVWNHTLAVVKSAEKRRPKDIGFILGSLYHDNAKGLDNVREVKTVTDASGNKIQKISDINHETVGKPRAIKDIMRLTLGKDVAQMAGFITEVHGDVRYNKNPEGFFVGKEKSQKRLLKQCAKYGRSKEDVKYLTDTIIEFSLCDADGFNDNLKSDVYKIAKDYEENYQNVLENTALYVKDLPVNGNDVKDILEGKQIGEYFEQLIKHNILDREQALNLAYKMSNKVQKPKKEKKKAYQLSVEDVQRYKKLSMLVQKTFENVNKTHEFIVECDKVIKFKFKKATLVILPNKIQLFTQNDLKDLFIVSKSNNLLDYINSEDFSKLLSYLIFDNKLKLNLLNLLKTGANLKKQIISSLKT